MSLEARRKQGILPLELDLPIEAGIQLQSDVFAAGVKLYKAPPTLKSIVRVWRGILPTRQVLLRVLDDDGNPLRQVTEIGLFGLYTGIKNIQEPRWLDINRAVQSTKRRSR